MSVNSTYDLDWHEAGADPLADRLRQLAWPSADPAIRDRCWTEFSQRMNGKLSAEEPKQRGRARIGDRYGCSRRLVPTGGLIAGGRLAAAQSWARSTPGGVFGHSRAFA